MADQPRWSENNSDDQDEEMMDLPRGDKRPMFDVGCGDQEELVDHKRSKSSPVYKWNVDSEEFPVTISEDFKFKLELINEPYLGLNLKKSQSLLDLIQARLEQDMLDQANARANNVVLPNENLQVINKKDVKERVRTSGPIDKLKASNFPAILLRIGKWEYVSQHEGDLVAKCYFAKHKLVWEILDGGLKSKIEIQWSDIVGLKANCLDNELGSLSIVLGKQPLFFRETNPQPRKHTLWQATCDFTNGEAIRSSEHYLQCAPGVLNKHYEKLVQCDTRLKHISEQQEKFTELPFGHNVSIKDSNMSNGNFPNQPVLSNESPISVLQNMGTLDLVHGDFMKQYRYANTTTPSFQQNMSVTDLVNHIGHRISEKKSDQVLPFFENVPSGVNQGVMFDNICQILLSDIQCTTASDEESLMSRVNSLCNLLQDGNDYPNHDIEMNRDHSQNQVHGLHDVIDYSTTYCTSIPMNDLDNEIVGMSRNDSFDDLLHQLPRIASLPKLLNDFSDDDNILDPE